MGLFYIINDTIELPEPEFNKKKSIYITDFMIDPKTGKEDLSKPSGEIIIRKNTTVKERLQKSIEYWDRIKQKRMNEEW